MVINAGVCAEIRNSSGFLMEKREYQIRAKMLRQIIDEQIETGVEG
jgi:hypothetical protein